MVMSMEKILSGSGNSEEMFPLEETEDQMMAIEAVKKIWKATRSWTVWSVAMSDLEKQKLRSVRHSKQYRRSKQVVYLVPTTILAQQHYRTFVAYERLFRCGSI